MLTQAIASVFSSYGVLPPQRYHTSRSESSEKAPVTAQVSPESAIVELSPEAQKLLAIDRLPYESEEKKEGKKGQKGNNSQNDLSEEEKKEVEELKKRDREVRAHEQAHVSAGGQYVRGGAQFEYKTGPDNRQYAVGGHVSIDSGPEKTPEATVRKAQVVKRAALAPADPSASDRAVAAKASKMESQARKEIAQKEREENAQDEDTEGVSIKGNLSEITESKNPLSSESGIQDHKISNYGQSTATLKIGELLNITA